MLYAISHNPGPEAFHYDQKIAGEPILVEISRPSTRWFDLPANGLKALKARHRLTPRIARALAMKRCEGAAVEESSVPILMYHSVSSPTNPLFRRWAVSPDLFEEHLTYLHERQYTPITVTDLARARVEGKALPSRPVALTFDDAYADFYENAYPALQRHGFVSTLYVPTAYVGGSCDWLVSEDETERPMATWSQLAEMSAGGVECGGHSHHHVHMDAIPTDVARMEIMRSKAILEDRLGRAALSFAYPHGWTTAEVKRMVQAAGYTSACAVKNTLSASSDDPFALARLPITGDMDVDIFARLLARQPSPLMAAVRDIVRPMWRFASKSQTRLSGDKPAVAATPAGRDTTLSWGQEFEPAAMLEVEISQPLPDTAPIKLRPGRNYRRALTLVRLHSQPLGLIEMPLWEGGMKPGQLALNIWEALGPQINAHLLEDGLPPTQELSVEGLVYAETPPCLDARQAFLEHAPFVSVVIPTHNRPQQAVALVDSVLASDYPSDRFEVIVVDNAPGTNDTAQFVAQAFGESAHVRYVREDQPGSSNARNRGVAHALGEIVVFADDVVRVDRHWLAEMVRGFDASEDVGCVTGLIVPMEVETPAQEWFEQFGGFCKSGMTRRIYNLTDHRAESPLFPYNVGLYGAGASMAFRRSVLLEIKGFDPALGPATLTLGGEDIDAMLRMILGGRTLVYAPAAIVQHRARREYAQLRRQMQGYGRGLAACLFKSMVTQPQQLPDFIGKLPRGLLFAFNPRSPHHAEKRSGYPVELSWIEMMGLFYGPLAYLLSHRRVTMSASLGSVNAYTEPRAVPLSEAR